MSATAHLSTPHQHDFLQAIAPSTACGYILPEHWDVTLARGCLHMCCFLPDTVFTCGDTYHIAPNNCVFGERAAQTDL